MQKNINNRSENNEQKSKAGSFWKHVGYVVLALGLACLTVFVLNLNI
ncbi:MAG: hypothetical protein J6C62_06450 [Clostridia bacterium]|nr:hypothetical protein [Clostridia bacterium]